MLHYKLERHHGDQHAGDGEAGAAAHHLVRPVLGLVGGVHGGHGRLQRLHHGVHLRRLAASSADRAPHSLGRVRQQLLAPGQDKLKWR